MFYNYFKNKNRGKICLLILGLLIVYYVITFIFCESAFIRTMPLAKSLIVLNYLSLVSMAFFIHTKYKAINILFSLFLTTIISLETYSFYFLGTEVSNVFLGNLFDLNFIQTAIKVRFLLCIVAVLFFIFVFLCLCIIIHKVAINNKIIKFCPLILPLTFLLSPFGFIHRISYILNGQYLSDLIKYSGETYQDIFFEIKNEEYIVKDKIKASYNKDNPKNLVFIYLESFERSYLYNDYLTNYTKNIKKLAEEGEFHDILPQLTNASFTTAAIFTTQCGVTYSVYPVIGTFLKKEMNNYLTCLPNILKVAGYNQVYIGGANSKLFHKSKLLNILEFDRKEDYKTLFAKNKNVPESTWGIYDKELFEIAKKEFVELSKNNKPFNLTLLTLATHNKDGVRDERCKNPDEINLANGIECTDYLLNDFINFLKTQPNYKDTLIVIIPDHVQFNENTLKSKIKLKEKKLYLIMLNSGKTGKFESSITHADIPEIVLDRLGITHNANFVLSNSKSSNATEKFNYIENPKTKELTRVFLFKIFK